ncbi:MAG: hypothetical protein HZA00_13865 [Nitrospinae bacterium]|nr:hypothetical protein [Nitrospinota bacterium]
MTEIFEPKIDIDSTRYLSICYGEPMVFHCHHYNVFLQQTIEDPEYLDTKPLLTNAAASCAYSQLKEMFSTEKGFDSPQSRFGAAESIFKTLGFGLLEGLKNQVTENGGLVRAKMSHYGYTWKIKFGLRDTPADFFTSGYLSGVMSAVYNKPAGYYVIEEKECAAKGDNACTFEVKAADSLLSIPKSPGKGSLLTRLPERERLPGNIDEPAILKALANLPLVGNEEGLIPAFGVYLTRMYSNYYNLISYGFEELLIKHKGPQMKNVSRPLLIEAGHVCAFNTFGGIMKSPEWYGLIFPMIKNREDWVHGMVAAINALGWGKWTVKELIPNERLVLIVDGSYESNGYLSIYGKSKTPECYLATGGSAGLMNLIYYGDITTKSALDQNYYNRLFKGKGNFKCEEVLCRSKGDDHCEFVVTKTA